LLIISVCRIGRRTARRVAGRSLAVSVRQPARDKPAHPVTLSPQVARGVVSPTSGGGGLGPFSGRRSFPIVNDGRAMLGL